MNDMYVIAGVTKQGHMQAIERENAWKAKVVEYLGLIATTRILHPGMGLRTMYAQLQPEGIGRDAFIDLGMEFGYRLQEVKVAHRTTFSVKSARFKNLLGGMRLTGVNQGWVSDLFYFPINGQHFYISLIMDVYTRQLVGYSIADNMRAENNVAALKMALERTGIEDFCGYLIHHSDRGSQYVSDAYTDLLLKYGVLISMSTSALDNAYAERVNGTIKNDYLSRWEIDSFSKLVCKGAEAIENYNNRYHTALKMSPNDFAKLMELTPIEKRVPMTHFVLNNLSNQETQLSISFPVQH
jgi:putative transposase